MKIVQEFDRFDEYQRRGNDEFKAGIIDMATGIQGAAQSIAPVDSGFMRDHIFLHSENYPEVTVESEANYSGYVESGTVDSPAQPFMRPAYEQSRLSSLARLEARINRALS